MEKSSRLDNTEIRNYIYKFVPDILNANETFVRVFGEKFASKKVRENVLYVYTNENSNMNYSGYHRSKEKSITICSSGKNNGVLSVEDIENSEDIKETALHEAIHAILERTKEECAQYNISGGTGLLETYIHTNGERSEIGRGLNEGFTEWLCKQMGLKAPAYKELTDMVSLIETAIGTEKTMELGKGGICKNFPDILKMSQEDVLLLLSTSDHLYIVNDRLSKIRKVIDILSKDEDVTQNEMTAENKELIEEYMQDPVFLHYAKTKGKEVTYETLKSYLKEERIPAEEEQKARTVISMESFLIDHYFINDFNEFLNGEDISDEKFIKLCKVFSLLNTDLYNVPKNIDIKVRSSTSISIKEQFSKLAEQQIKKIAIREAEKHKNGEFDLQEFINLTNKICISNEFLDIYLNEFSNAISAEFSKDLKGIFRSLIKSDKTIPLNDASIYKIVSADPKKDISSLIIYDKENIISKFFPNGIYTCDSVVSSVNDKVDFDFTLDGSIEDEYKLAMANFMDLKRRVFSKNPNAKIHISSREIVVQDGDNVEFYVINKGELVPMQIQKQLDLQFVKDKKENTQEEKEESVIPVKTGFWQNLINKIKRKISQFKNRNNSETVNFGDELNGQVKTINNSQNPIDKYVVKDFDERRKSLEASGLKSEVQEDKDIKGEIR